MPDLLLEVLSEEIPARMQAGGADQLKKQVLSRLKEARLNFETPQHFATPRRLALIVPGLPAQQPDMTVERKGPRVDAPEKAIAGFLKSTGLTLDDCEQRETPKGPVWFAVMQEKGRPTADLLADLLPEALAAVSWPKSMRWDESGVRWVRPIRSILCLLDDAVVPFRFGTVESGRTTLGHRFLSPGLLRITEAGGYAAQLEDAKVMLDPERRAQMIRKDAEDRARGERLTFTPDDWLMTENVGLVEWPVVLMGAIDERFMDLPPEVRRSAMRAHQRYFSLLDKDLRQAARFVMVSNAEIADDGIAVVAGNERVLRARLADARFFWDQDRRHTLDDHLPALKDVVFHARLGSIKDKAERVSSLARTMCRWIKDADADHAARAGLLCKADLLTELVGEFPDLQGTMGGYYAKDCDEPRAVYEAIESHYAPQGPLAYLPTAPVSVAVALADKLDTLAGFFAIDERPTGSKDPFALRRAALGVIRLIIENKLRLSLDQVLTKAINGYDDMLSEEPGPKATLDALLAFFDDRLRVHLRDLGYRHDLVNAALSAHSERELVGLLERVEALDRFLESDDGANLLTAYRRAANILRIEEKKDSARYNGKPDPLLFNQDEERILHKRIYETKQHAVDALNSNSPEKSIRAMATLRAPVDAFFDHVTVNCEDPALRRNRLLMLSQIRTTLDWVADFSKIEG
ncbi:MAG: glycine--tRNA ligase subunit beta [Rhodospirillales bacterium]|nr:glycine--tRNA ligase subunit beta [Rhodospirillales bacterium]